MSGFITRNEETVLVGILPRYVEDSLYDANVRDKKINDSLSIIDGDLDYWLQVYSPNRIKRRDLLHDYTYRHYLDRHE